MTNYKIFTFVRKAGKTPKQQEREAKQAISAIAEEARKKVEAKKENPQSVRDLQFKDD